MRVKMSRGMRIPLLLSMLAAVSAVAVGLCDCGAVWRTVRGLWPVGAAILLHELGHGLAARACGVRLSSLRISLFGARLGLVGMLSYRREGLIAAAGPAVNLLSAAVLLLPRAESGSDAVAAYLSGGEASAVFALASLGLAAINLLPVRSLDGGRILRCTLAPLCGERAADAVLTLGTALCLGALWCLSVYSLLRVGEMLSLFAFSLCLLLRMTGGD